MIIYKNDYPIIINETLFETIKNINPEILEEAVDFSTLLLSKLKSKYNIVGNKEQEEIIKNELKNYSTKELENIATHKLNSFVDDLAKKMNLIDDTNDVETNIEDRIIDDQKEKNGENISSDFSDKIAEIDKEAERTKEEENIEKYKNMSDKERQQKIKDDDKKMNKEEDLPEKTYSFNNIIADNKDMEKLINDIGIYEALAKLSRNIIDRCVHVIRVSTGNLGSRHNNIGGYLSLAIGGFKFSKLKSTSKSSTIKYYLGELEKINPEQFNGLRNILTVSSDNLNKMYRGNTEEIVDTINKYRNAIYNTCYLLHIGNEKNFNDIRRAIYMDDVLSSKFYISSSGRQQVLDIKEEVIIFRPREYPKYIACIIVMRPFLAKTKMGLKGAKEIWDAIGTLPEV